MGQRWDTWWHMSSRKVKGPSWTHSLDVVPCCAHMSLSSMIPMKATFTSSNALVSGVLFKAQPSGDFGQGPIGLRGQMYDLHQLSPLKDRVVGDLKQGQPQGCTFRRWTLFHDVHLYHLETERMSHQQFLRKKTYRSHLKCFVPVQFASFPLSTFLQYYIYNEFESNFDIIATFFTLGLSSITAPTALSLFKGARCRWGLDSLRSVVDRGSMDHPFEHLRCQLVG